jgi:hypothetical protein
MTQELHPSGIEKWHSVLLKRQRALTTAGCLVHAHDSGLPQKRPCHAKQLPLPDREIFAIF